jgi:predicted TIM-barrel fold metal-dependent hydrolase
MTDRPPFVETHVHFHDMKHPTMKWAWLEWGWIHPILGDIGALQSQRYLAEEFLHETRFQNVSKVIHVQAALGSPNPVDETVWLQEAFERTGIPHGIVAEAPLAQDDVEAILDQHAEASPNLRGIRNFGQGDYLVEPAWKRGYAKLAKHDLVCCLDSSPEVYAKAKALAQEVPDVTLCLDHTGFPRERTDAYFENWKRELANLAQADNVVIKISGLGMCDPDWTVDSFRPWVETSIELFGTERSFFGTNWPVDRLYSSYGDVLDAYWEIIKDYSPAEKTALWSGNAERIFRI